MDSPAPPRRTRPTLGAPQVVFVIILLFWIFANPDDQTGPANVSFGQARDGKVLTQQDVWNERIHFLRGQLDVLRNETYNPLPASGDLYQLNLTGFRERDGYAWNVLEDVKERARKVTERAIGVVPVSRRDLQQTDKPIVYGDIEEVAIPVDVEKEYAPKSFYRNASGLVRGHWVLSKMFDQRVGEELRKTRETGLNLTELAPETIWSGLEVKRNITGKEGKITLNIDDVGSEISGTWNNVTGVSMDSDPAETVLIILCRFGETNSRNDDSSRRRQQW